MFPHDDLKYMSTASDYMYTILKVLPGCMKKFKYHNSGLPRSGKNTCTWKMKFFPGQGKVRKFCKWSGKFRKDFESQGKVREFEMSMSGRLILFKEG